ncbi:MAG: hypothetical protein L3J18_15845 [Candidatus Brocadia sp.]|jgi:hypothetical protein|uniref:Uncharacterized protein n=1 Tax=Candidatus Brocadia fulgida TaxID=380242 RepID=A0A0M2UZV7_9BACT|nr:MAG: hypothetical protein BROFUL_00166 [Candidatus Brocadia fulgida]OQY98576.1 MAG: hypothetical protein B6D35_11790 [Candidatus Brocadia sp. UTAMX2]UJS20345.1 MAG: hypothetical protein L3J18_15845 [Candidatus Brocadia sp.]
MGKDSALGHDPLNWMKVVQESKKSVSLGNGNAADQNTTRSEQPAGPQVTAKQHAPASPGDDKTPPVLKEPQPQNKTDNRAGGASVPKQKVMIGRLYEKPSAEKTKSTPHTEIVSPVSRPYSGPSLPASPRLQPVQKSERTTVPFSLSADRMSTYIIVAYTALLLILGYFVYHDLSKRTSRIEARLFAVEKALRLKQR